MSSSRRKVEERTTKLLRELATEPGNKTCFDCHQRGPTYINMTIGAFVCTGCSGILRGLNPPHRVKSISMASFTPDEVEFLRQRGNVYCKRVWLGLYDGSRQDGARDEQQMKDFLALKYEKRRWYVEPSEVARQESLREAHPPAASAAAPTTTSQPLGHSVEPPDKTAARPHPHPSAGHTPTTKTPSLDLFAADPFASPTKPTPPAGAQPTPFAQAAASHPPVNNGPVTGFADFDSAFDALSLSSAPTSFTHHQPAATTTAASAFGSGDPFGAAPPAFHHPAPPPAVAKPPPGFGTPLVPPTAAPPPHAHPIHKSATMPPTSAASATSNADKYSALKELDSLFSTDVGGGSDTTSGVSSFTSSWSSTPAGLTPGKPAFPDPSHPVSTASHMPKSVSAMGAFGASPPSFSAFGTSPPGYANGGGGGGNPFAGPPPSMGPSPGNPFLGGGGVGTGGMGTNGGFGIGSPFAHAPAWSNHPPHTPQQPVHFPHTLVIMRQMGKPFEAHNLNGSSGGGHNWNPFL